MCGNNPEKISRYILEEELVAYRACVASQKLFITQGEKDGWRDETFLGQLVTGIMCDEVWHESTAFIEQYENVYRVDKKPYYYVDFPEKQVRCIFMCSGRYEYEAEHKMFEKYHTWGLEQIIWLQEEALAVEKNWSILLFSHDIPNSRFEMGKDPFIYNGYAGEKVLRVLQEAMWNQGVRIAAWFAGHYGYDCEARIASVNHVIIGSQAHQMSCGAKVDGARYEMGRIAQTVDEDLWDVFLVKLEERKIYAFRFGAGVDRVINF